MNPEEDTEWNDVLRAKGIIPPKQPEVTEEDIMAMVDQAALKAVGEKAFEDMSLEELDDLEDDEDEEILMAYRADRIKQMKELAKKSKFGELINITANEYKQEVNQAGEGVWVLVFLYKNEYLVCRRMQDCLKKLAAKFPMVKFVQSVSTTCIPNYPDKNLPSLFVYFEDDMKKQWIGPSVFGGEAMTPDNIEWSLSRIGVLETELEEDPRGLSIRSTLSTMRSSQQDDSDDSD